MHVAYGSKNEEGRSATEADGGRPKGQDARVRKGARSLGESILPRPCLPPLRPTLMASREREGKKERRRGGRGGGFCFATPHSLETFLVLFYVLFGLGPPRAKKKRRGEKGTAGRRSEGRAGGRGRDLATPPESRCMRRGLREFPTR